MIDLRDIQVRYFSDIWGTDPHVMSCASPFLFLTICPILIWALPLPVV